MYHLSDLEFEKRFADCSLDPRFFNHEAHLRLAWIHVTRYGLLAAIENIRQQIKAYDKKHGDGTKYHETVTIASVNVVNHCVQQSSAKTFEAFIKEFPGLKSQFMEMLRTHYSQERFQDIRGKTEYLSPDLLPFPDRS